MSEKVCRTVSFNGDPLFGGKPFNLRFCINKFSGHEFDPEKISAAFGKLVESFKYVLRAPYMTWLNWKWTSDNAKTVADVNADCFVSNRIENGGLQLYRLNDGSWLHCSKWDFVDPITKAEEDAREERLTKGIAALISLTLYSIVVQSAN